MQWQQKHYTYWSYQRHPTGMFRKSQWKNDCLVPMYAIDPLSTRRIMQSRQQHDLTCVSKLSTPIVRWSGNASGRRAWTIATITYVSEDADVCESPNWRGIRRVNSQVRRHVHSKFSAE